MLELLRAHTHALQKEAHLHLKKKTELYFKRYQFSRWRCFAGILRLTVIPIVELGKDSVAV